MKYHVVSAAHVTHPFLYPKLYPEEFPRFLSFLSETDVKVTLQYRQLNEGILLEEFDMKRRYSVKQENDLVIGHLEDESQFEETLKNKFACDVDPLILMTEDERIELKKQLEIVGHDFSVSANGHPVLVPTSLEGTLLGASKKRIVVGTAQPSVMGLCGGPALLVENGKPTSYVIGMVEGRIQAKSPSNVSLTDEERKIQEQLVDHTVLVSSTIISDFVDSVEADIETHLENLPSPTHKSYAFQDNSPTGILTDINDLSQNISMPIPPRVEIWNPKNKRTEIDF